MVFDDHEYCPACGHHSFTQVNMNQLPMIESFEWTSKRLDSKVLDRYGVGYDAANDKVVMPHYSPSMELLCYVTRSPQDRDFRTHGPASPFGLHLLGNSDELVICEGQSDTLSAATVWSRKDCIGLPGAQTVSKLAQYLSHLRKYKKITVLPDSDDAGQDMVSRLRELLPASKLYVASLGLKDVNSYLLDGCVQDLHTCYDLAVTNHTSVFVTVEDIARYYSESSISVIPTGIDALDYMLGGGIEVGGFTLVAGHTGKGKSSVAYNIICNALKLGTRVLYLAGETSPKESIKRLAKVYNQGKPYTDEHGAAIAVNMHINGLRVYKYSLDTDTILDTITHAVMDEGVQLVVIDVLSDIEGFDFDYSVAGRAVAALKTHATGDDREGRPPYALLGVAHTKGDIDGDVTINAIRGGKCVPQKSTCIVGFSVSKAAPNRRVLSLLKLPRMVDDYCADPVVLEYDRYTYQYTEVDTHDSQEDGQEVRLTARRDVSHSEPTPDLPPEGHEPALDGTKQIQASEGPA